MTLKFPGLIDPHVHLREPGAAHKEDFDSGTASALGGGFTAILAMPNTSPALTDSPTLAMAHKAARTKARCDYGIYLGAGSGNVTEAVRIAAQACGLKLYLDQTYGPLHLEGLAPIQAHLVTWPKDRPVAAHAEGTNLAAVLLLAAFAERPIHICHVSRKDEIVLIRSAKEKGLEITCEVTPHHMFLTETDLPQIGAKRGTVRPPLATVEDQVALWDNLEVIDCFASDHAPHTLAEKESDSPPPGLPGLETALPLFYSAVNDGRLTLEDLIQRMYTNPKRIFSLPDQQETFVNFDPDSTWEVRGHELHSRCGWTPFQGMKLTGRVRAVYLRGRKAFADNHVLAPPGTGQDLCPSAHIHNQAS